MFFHQYFLISIPATDWTKNVYNITIQMCFSKNKKEYTSLGKHSIISTIPIFILDTEGSGELISQDRHDMHVWKFSSGSEDLYIMRGRVLLRSFDEVGSAWVWCWKVFHSFMHCKIHILLVPMTDFQFSL